MPSPSFVPVRRALRVAVRAVVAASLVSALAIAPAAAGRPSSGAVVRVDDGVFGGTTVAYAGPASATWVRAKCYQGGALVYEQYRQFDATRRATLTLGPTPSWSGGSATCTAEDGYWHRGTTFRVSSASTFAVIG